MSTTNTRPPPKEIFFAPLQVDLSPKDLECVQFAYVASKYGHSSQVRDGGERYFDHPKAAAWIYIHELEGRDVRTIVDLLLHDLVEDAYLLTPYRLRINFGADVAYDIHALTKLPKGKETTEQYLGRVASRGLHAIVAKLCDRLHNLRTIGCCLPEKRAKTITETRDYHLKMLIPSLAENGPEGQKLAAMLESMIRAAIDAAEKM